MMLNLMKSLYRRGDYRLNPDFLPSGRGICRSLEFDVAEVGVSFTVFVPELDQTE